MEFEEESIRRISLVGLDDWSPPACKRASAQMHFSDGTCEELVIVTVTEIFETLWSTTLCQTMAFTESKGRSRCFNNNES